MIYAVIDIGSNTIRLSTYEYRNGTVKKLFHKKSTAGLAGFISEDTMSDAGIQRCCQVLLDFRDTLELLPIEELGIFATASLRNIRNSDEAIRTINAGTGYTIQLLSGKEEAEYGYYGIRCMYRMDHGLAVDIGGGSTELTLFTDGTIQYANSFPVGSLNMYKRNISGILPSEKERLLVRKETRDIIGKDTFKTIRNCGDIVAVGGSARAILKIANTHFRLADENLSLTLTQLEQLHQTLCKKENHAADLILQSCPDRIHTLIPGLIILTTILKETGEQTLSVCPYGVREGYLLKKLLKTEGDTPPSILNT